ncbi:hypothetical protein H1R17_10140 [Flavobacterium sp. xlx-214]|uniref:hypothetical protein n=1 Tax=unclassified Flavobacterium TaxID=196869 RepID=UPI0013D6B756|nr:MULTISPECIES: hypothetical protein [unclassified Flavobacterium]MBA5791573.1 hypothetical protein [Flavobacterium sp. xlx-221]QMI82822.1 hypothetical protein H1R17_10140 [Flavobacterium sp. xlx-214]
MKKFIFSALACVAFAGSSFASNEIVNCKQLNSVELQLNSEDINLVNENFIIKEQLVVNNGLCEIVILVFDRGGNLIDAVSRKSANVSADWCANSYNRMLDMMKQDYSIEDYDFKAGYGHTAY